MMENKRGMSSHREIKETEETRIDLNLKLTSQLLKIILKIGEEGQKRNDLFVYSDQALTSNIILEFHELFWKSMGFWGFGV